MCARAFSLRTHTTPYIESNLNATATTTTNNNCLYHKCLENKTKKFSSLLPSLCVYMCGLFRFFYSFYRTKSVVIVSLCVSLLSFRSCFIYDTLLLFSFSYLHLIVSRQIRFNFSIISALATSKSCVFFFFVFLIIVTIARLLPSFVCWQLVFRHNAFLRAWSCWFSILRGGTNRISFPFFFLIEKSRSTRPDNWQTYHGPFESTTVSSNCHYGVLFGWIWNLSIWSCHPWAFPRRSDRTLHGFLDLPQRRWTRGYCILGGCVPLSLSSLLSKWQLLSALSPQSFPKMTSNSILSLSPIRPQNILSGC